MMVAVILLNVHFTKYMFPIEMEDVNLKVFDMIKERYESKILSKHISCECRCEFDGKTCNSRQNWNIP